MMDWPLGLFLALRFLREGRAQSALIIVGASAGVSVVVFLTSLMAGLESSLLERTLGTQAHVVVTPREERARPLRDATRGQVVLASIDRPAQRPRSIEGWQTRIREIEAMAGVTGVSPSVSGAGVATRGTSGRSVAIHGIDGRRFDQLYAIHTKIVHGAFLPNDSNAVVGIDLARDVGVSVGGRFRVVVADGRSATFRVAGIFDLGNLEVNRRWVLMSMRSAQALLGLRGGVSNLDVRVVDPFDAETVAGRIEDRTALEATSWMSTNAQLLTALESQRASTRMIDFFVALAVSLGIASVLVVSVVQRGRQIGILRAIGASRGTVQRVFLIQGAIVGFGGSIVGAAIGAALGALFVGLIHNADGSPLFPIRLTSALLLQTIAIASIVGLVSAIAPARRASRLDPAEAIRGG